MKITLEIEFYIGDLVYLKTDKEQKPRIISGIQIRENNRITYLVCQEINENIHYGFELSKTKDIILATSN